MKTSLSWNVLLSSVLAVSLICSIAPVSYAEPRQVLQGTQVHLTLLSTISTSASRDGDPFVAIVAEPVCLGSQLLIPAGTRVHGVIGTVAPARKFSVFRGQAYVNLTFRTLEIDSRLIPVQMSILTLEQPRSGGNEKARKDVKVVEGQVVEQKHDYKGDVIGATVGTGGGTLIGAVFSHVVRGFGIGLAGCAAYIVARKGKEVDIPAKSTMLVRMDNTVTVRGVTQTTAAYNSSR
jgi:hypothetical protein